jgi:hypothetical protein
MRRSRRSGPDEGSPFYAAIEEVVPARGAPGDVAAGGARSAEATAGLEVLRAWLERRAGRALACGRSGGAGGRAEGATGTAGASSPGAAACAAATAASKAPASLATGASCAPSDVMSRAAASTSPSGPSFIAHRTAASALSGRPACRACLTTGPATETSLCYASAAAASAAAASAAGPSGVAVPPDAPGARAACSETVVAPASPPGMTRAAATERDLDQPRNQDNAPACSPHAARPSKPRASSRCGGRTAFTPRRRAGMRPAQIRTEGEATRRRAT